MSMVHRSALRIAFAAAVCVASVMGQSASAGDLVFNGGFETGNFLGWNVPPNQANQTLFFVSLGDPHSGNYYGRMASSTLQFMSQTLPTTAGTDYELSFWLRWTVPMLGEHVNVRWEGQSILVIPGTLQPIAWTQYTVPLHASITGSFLEFGQTAFPGEFHIDDISVVPVPAPSAAPLLLLGSAVALRRRRR